MKTLETRIPDRLNRTIDALVEQGWFPSRDDVVREAIR
jgi:Arc/MetJ-type ribon-helix-helix transcriptional regulator